MKKCPFCKAEIEDNAVFCFYCMKSLEGKESVPVGIKEKSKHPILLFFLVLLIIGAGILFWVSSCDKNTDGGQGSTADEVFVTDEDHSFPPTENSEESIAESQNKTDKSSEPIKNNNEGVGSANSSLSGGTSGSGQKPGGSQGNSITPSYTEEFYPSEQPYEEPDITTTPVREPDYYWPVDTTFPLVSNVTYYYRQAQRGDDFSINYPFTENDIVITGVGGVSGSGLYIIPPKIDGKRVIGISGLSFSEEDICKTVLGVVVPDSVLTISSNAFYGCENMTDIYFCGKSVFTDTNAFSTVRNGTLTIHCAYDCSDRNFRYYRNSASYFGALYEEWYYMG